MSDGPLPAETAPLTRTRSRDTALVLGLAAVLVFSALHSERATSARVAARTPSAVVRREATAILPEAPSTAILPRARDTAILPQAPAPTSEPVVTLSRQALLRVVEKTQDPEETNRFLEKARFFEPLDEAQLGWVERHLSRSTPRTTRVLEGLANRAPRAEPAQEPPGKTKVSLAVAERILAETDDPGDAVHALEGVDFLFPIDESNLTELARAAPMGARGAVAGYLERRAAARPQERRAPHDPDGPLPFTFSGEASVQVGAAKSGSPSK